MFVIMVVILFVEKLSDDDDDVDVGDGDDDDYNFGKNYPWFQS